MDNRRFVANLLEVSPNSLKELPDYAIAKIVELYGKASGDVLPAGWEVSHPLLSLEKFNGLPATRGPLVGTRFIYDLTAPIPCSMFKLLTPVEIAPVWRRISYALPLHLHDDNYFETNWSVHPTLTRLVMAFAACPILVYPLLAAAVYDPKEGK